jgi:hypothetical protein
MNGIHAYGDRGKSSGILKVRGLRFEVRGKIPSLKKRSDPTSRQEDASIDRANHGDEFFRLDSPGIFCKSDIVEFARLPRRNVRREPRSSLASPSSLSVASVVF